MRELKTGLFFLAFSSFTILESLRVGLGTVKRPGSGFLPFSAGCVLATFSLVHLFKGLRDRESAKPLSGRVIAALVFLLIYSLALDSLGFMICTFVLVGVFFRLAAPRPWWFLVLMSAGVTLSAYFVFGILLHVYFPEGVFGL
jgi:putative tricarboxylic transport membrane protein